MSQISVESVTAQVENFINTGLIEPSELVPDRYVSQVQNQLVQQDNQKGRRSQKKLLPGEVTGRVTGLDLGRVWNSDMMQQKIFPSLGVNQVVRSLEGTNSDSVNRLDVETVARGVIATAQLIKLEDDLLFEKNVSEKKRNRQRVASTVLRSLLNNKPVPFFQFACVGFDFVQNPEGGVGIGVRDEVSGNVTQTIQDTANVLDIFDRWRIPCSMCVYVADTDPWYQMMGIDEQSLQGRGEFISQADTVVARTSDNVTKALAGYFAEVIPWSQMEERYGVDRYLQLVGDAMGEVKDSKSIEEEKMRIKKDSIKTLGFCPYSDEVLEDIARRGIALYAAQGYILSSEANQPLLLQNEYPPNLRDPRYDLLLPKEQKLTKLWITPYLFKN